MIMIGTQKFSKRVVLGPGAKVTAIAHLSEAKAYPFGVNCTPFLDFDMHRA
jgi:hypothetical protein